MFWLERFKKIFFTTPELSERSLSKNFWLFAAVFFLLLASAVPAGYLIRGIFHWSQATTWSLNSDIDPYSAITGYRQAMVMSSDGYPYVVFSPSGDPNYCMFAVKLGATGSVTASSTLDCNMGNAPGGREKARGALSNVDNNPSFVFSKNISGTRSLIFSHFDGATWATSTVASTSSIAYIDSGIAYTGSGKAAVAYSEGWGTTGGSVNLYLDGVGTTSVVNSTGINRFDSVATTVQTASSSLVVFYKDDTQLKMIFNATGSWTEDPNIIDGALPNVSAVTYFRINAAQDASGVLRVYYSGGTSANNLVYGVRNNNGTWTTTTVITGNTSWLSGAYNSASAYDGIASYNSTAGSLVYAQNSSGSWSTETASSTNSAGTYADLAFYGGLPAISYQYTTGGGTIRNSITYGAVGFGNQTPTAPTTLYSHATDAQSGDAEPTNLTSATPYFSAIFNDLDAGDIGNKAQIQITTTTDSFVTVNQWDSGSSGTTISDVVADARSQNIQYGDFGTAPLRSMNLGEDTPGGDDTVYYWRIRFWDDGGATGTWSSQGTFTLSDAPTAPSGASVVYGITTSTVSWTDNSSNETEFQILKSTNGATYTFAASSTVDTLTTTTIDLTPNTKYWWQVKSYNADGLSAETTAGGGVNDYTQADVPAGLEVNGSCTASNGCLLSVYVTDQNGNPDDTKYQYYNVTTDQYSYRGGTTWINENSSYWNAEETTSYFFSGKAYTFQVRARNNAAVPVESAWVSVSSTTPPLVIGDLGYGCPHNTGSTWIDCAWATPPMNASGVTYQVRRYSSTNPLDDSTSAWFTATTGTLDGSENPDWYMHHLTGLTASTTYNIIITAKSDDGTRTADNADYYLSATTFWDLGGGTMQSWFAEQAAIASAQREGSDFSCSMYLNLQYTASGALLGNTTLEEFATSSLVRLEGSCDRGGSNNYIPNEIQISDNSSFTGATWQTLSNSNVTSGFVNYKTTWNLPAGGGLKTVYVKLRAAGSKLSNTCTDTVTLLTEKPAAPVFTSPINNANISSSYPIFAGTVTAGMTEVRLELPDFFTGGLTIPIYLYNNTTTWYLAPKAPEFLPLLGGTHIVAARAVDQAGNLSDSASVTFIVTATDFTPPDPPILLEPKMDVNTTFTTGISRLVGTAEPGSKVIIERVINNDSNNPVTYQADANESGNWQIITLFGDWQNGNYQLKLTAHDQAGNVSQPLWVSFVLKMSATVKRELAVEDVKLKETIVQEQQKIEEQKKEEVKRPEPEEIAKRKIIEDTENASVLASLPIVGGLLSSGSADFGLQATQQGSTMNSSDSSTQQPELTPTSFFPTAAQISDATQAVVVATQAVGKQVQAASQQIQKSAKAARVVMDKPAVQITNTAIVVPTMTVAASAAVGTAVSAAVGLPQAFLYLQFLFTQPFYLLRRRKAQKSGVVFNSISNMPVDLAVVRVIDEKTNQVVKSRVTDMHGRYEFFVDPGQYRLEVNKPQHLFPSALLAGKTEADKYANLYNGGGLKEEQEALLNFNAPVDPAHTEEKIETILSNAWKRKIGAVVSSFGIISALVSYVVTPKLWILGMVGVHTALFFLMRRLARAPQPKNWGIVMDAKTKQPLARAVVRIFDTQYNKLLETQVTDAKGRYAFLVGNNEYYLMIDKVGFQKFISTPIKITDAKEGATVAVDVPMVSDTSQSVLIEVPKSADAVPIAAEILPLPIVPTEVVLKVQPVEPVAVEPATKTVPFVQKLFLPIGSGARVIEIIGSSNNKLTKS